MLSVAIPAHEPWADEAQAWMLARSLSPWQMLHTYLRYEGAPGLWHLLLWVLIRLHISYTGMHWIAGGIAVAGVSVLVLRAPFPRWLKLSLPFTFFLAFQYAVVARNYVLVPLLLFSVAATWRQSPILVGLLLGLLCNVSGHTAAIAGGFALAYAIDQHKSATLNQTANRIGAALFLCLAIVALLTAFPPKDVDFLQPAKTAPPFAVAATARAITALLWGMFDPMFAGLAFWGLFVWRVARSSNLHFLLPIGTFVLFSAAIYVNFWHSGLALCIAVAVLWITWPKVTQQRLNPTELGMRWALALLVVTQIGWAAHAFNYDDSHPYSPDVATAHFLQPFISQGDQIAVTYLRDTGVMAFHSVGIAPYFHEKLFMNQSNAFWYWSRTDHTEDRFRIALRSHPRIILAVYYAMEPISASEMNTPKVRMIEASGYRSVATFCGTKPERFTTRENICHLIFVRNPGDSLSSAQPASSPPLHLTGRS